MYADDTTVNLSPADSGSLLMSIGLEMANIAAKLMQQNKLNFNADTGEFTIVGHQGKNII